MKLQEFVKESLLAIVQGVVEAQRELPELIGPEVDKPEDAANPMFETTTGHLAQMVKFDVAVTTEDSTSGDAGGQIKILALSVGAKGLISNAERTVSRIQFEVPVILPGFTDD